MIAWKPALLALSLSATSPSLAQESCLRPTPVPTLAHIRVHTLAIESNLGPAFVGEKCSRLDHDGRFAKVIRFYILPPSTSDTDPAFVFIKSYRTFSVETRDKIKMSRGEGWHSEKSAAARPDYIAPQRLNDKPFRNTIEKWNDYHIAESTPESLRQKLGQPWHAYADADKALASTEPISFWQTGPFDFGTGMLTNYLIRFPANTTTPIRFEVGYDDRIKEFRLEFYSSIDALSEKSYRFVFR